MHIDCHDTSLMAIKLTEIRDQYLNGHQICIIAIKYVNYEFIDI